MGRSSKNKNKRSQSNSPKNNNNSNSKNKNHKRRKFERFWVEDCQDVKVAEGQTCIIEVLITRTELADDYRQAPKPKEPELPPGKDASVETPTHGEKKPKPILKTDEKTSAEKNLEQENTEDVSETTEADQKNATPKMESTKDSELPKEKEVSWSENAQQANHEVNIETPQEEADAKEVQASSNVLGDGEAVAVAKVKSSSNGDKAANIKKKRNFAKDSVVSVKRSKSAKRPIKKVFDSVENFVPLPDGDCGDGIVNPFPKEEVPDKYWAQRRRLFTKFDEGVQLDKESWYSVTPEAIANQIAGRLVAGQENVTVLDPFCGCGGNAIALALREEVDLVVCVDKDVEKLKKAASNARIYGIPHEKMIFIHDDACHVLSCYKDGYRVDEAIGKSEVPETKSCEYKIAGIGGVPEKIDVVFLSPPWGGMDYGKVGKRKYDLTCIKVDTSSGPASVDGEGLLDLAASAIGGKAIALFLPRNINGIALGRSAVKAGCAGPLVLEQNVLNGKLKTVTAYVGL